MTTTPTVLFVCVHNSGRSLAARVLLDDYARGRVRVESAGSEPGDQLNSSVVAVLIERGLDPTREFPKPLSDQMAKAADVVVTMGCGDTCPVYPGQRHLDWELVDPAGKTVEEVRPIHRRDRPPGSGPPGRAARPVRAGCGDSQVVTSSSSRARVRSMSRRVLPQ